MEEQVPKKRTRARTHLWEVGCAEFILAFDATNTSKSRKPRDRSVARIVYAEEKKEASVIIKEVFADMKQATTVKTVRDGEEALPICSVRGNATLPVCRCSPAGHQNAEKNGYEVLESMKK